jgi:hypothetical protein
VRVLEPSPPAVAEPPYFADDPLDGGEVLPVARPGARSWQELCSGANDPVLLDWCRDRWLVRRPLSGLPASFEVTRDALHALAEQVLAPARFRANGKIGLRFTYRGFGTPFLDDDRQLRVADGALFDRERRTPLTSLADVAAFVGIELGATALPYEPTTTVPADAPLPVDKAAAQALGDWFGFGASLLEQLRAEDAQGGGRRVQLWPEHFDLALDLGPDGARANYGASPGDAQHAEPYLYVGPWDRFEGEFWN